jgi:hypothetical protein
VSVTKAKLYSESYLARAKNVSADLIQVLNRHNTFRDVSRSPVDRKDLHHGAGPKRHRGTGYRIRGVRAGLDSKADIRRRAGILNQQFLPAIVELDSDTRADAHRGAGQLEDTRIGHVRETGSDSAREAAVFAAPPADTVRVTAWPARARLLIWMTSEVAAPCTVATTLPAEERSPQVYCCPALEVTSQLSCRSLSSSVTLKQGALPFLKAFQRNALSRAPGRPRRNSGAPGTSKYPEHDDLRLVRTGGQDPRLAVKPN